MVSCGEQQSVAALPRRIGITPDVRRHHRRARGHPLEQDYPEGLAEQRGRAEDVCAAQARNLLGLIDWSQPLKSSVTAVQRLEALGLRSAACDPDTNVRREQLHRLKQDSQSFARFVTTDEQNRWRARGVCRALAVAANFHAVEEHVVAAAEVFAGEFAGVF